MYAAHTVGMLQANIYMKNRFRIKYKRKPILTAISHILLDVLQRVVTTLQMKHFITKPCDFC